MFTYHYKEVVASNQSIGQRKLVNSVGVNDAWYMVMYRTNDGRLTCPYYMRWVNMLKRCYDEKYQANFPTYKGCSVCKEWLLFSNFKRWMETQDWYNNELDKDIIKYGNKVYSPENCVFVSNDINSLLLGHKSCRGKYPQGVCFKKSIGKFVAQIKKHGETKHIGYYSTPERASDMYKQAKYEHMIQIACDQSDVRIHDGLIEHARMIYNG